MTVYPVPSPLFHLTDPTTGLPLALGKIYTYAAGTTTPKQTWADADKVAANPNPVILNANGDAAIYLDGAYKFRATRADGSMVYELDDVVSVIPLQASFITYDSDGTDITAQNVQDAITELDGDKQPRSASLTSLAAAFSPASSVGPASLALAEDTDNGGNTIKITAPAAVASDKVQALQDASGTIYVSGGMDVAISDGGTGAGSAPDARTNLGLVIGTDVLGPSNQTLAEAASSNAVALTPGTAQFHPGSAKAWGYATISAGVLTLRASYNITSVARQATGDYLVTLDADFSSAFYAVLVSPQTNVASAGYLLAAFSLTAGTFRIGAQDESLGVADPPGFFFACFGDQ
jgi:hypothetical protein